MQIKYDNKFMIFIFVGLKQNKMEKLENWKANEITHSG